jgi:gliding motility-associated-like protein
LENEGNYERTTLASDGCDSIIQLFLNVESVSSSERIDTFCEGELFTYLDISADEPGIYQTIIPNRFGCDSLITLELYEIPIGDGILIPEELNIDLGEVVNINPAPVDDRYNSFFWLNSNDEIIANTVDLVNFLPFETERISLYAEDIYGCSLIEYVNINVEKNYNFFIPNVFSPDGNGINDSFKFFSSLSVAEVFSFSVFDRWGNLVFHEEDVIFDENYIGWDGTFYGNKAEIGVYTYFLDVLFIDGIRKKLIGSVTLLK